jgi:hypothetical protein
VGTVFLDTGGDAGVASSAQVGRKSPAQVWSDDPDRRADALVAQDGHAGRPAETSRIGIETSSLTDVPLTLESVQPISDEAQMEMTRLEVAQTLGVRTDHRQGVFARPRVKPLDGLEIDAPCPIR